MLSSCLGLAKEEVVCVCGWGGRAGCQRVAAGKLPPSFPGLSAAMSRRLGESFSLMHYKRKSSDAAKRYSEQQRTSNYNAAHFYSLLNCAGGRMGAVKAGTDVWKDSSVCFWFPFFCNSNRSFFPSEWSISSSLSLGVFTVAVAGNWCHGVCNDLMCLWGSFGDRQRQFKNVTHRLGVFLADQRS